MVENHTRDLLQLKAKETQLARSRNDVELTQAALSKTQRDLESLRQSMQGDASKEIEVWKARAEKAEQRIMEREELDRRVMDRLTDLEEFVRGLDDETRDASVVTRFSSRCKDLEEQNRRLLAQLEEYSSRINTLEDVCDATIHLTIVELETSNHFTSSEREYVLVSIIYFVRLRRREREFVWEGSQIFFVV